jgi:phosphate/sulfate permease
MTNVDINNLLSQASQTASDANSLAVQSSSDIATSLSNSANAIQSIVGDVINNGYVISSEQMSQLNQYMAQIKLDALKTQSQQTFQTYGVYITVGVVLVVGLWLLSKNMKKNG